MMQNLESRGVIIPTDYIDMVVGVMCHWLSSERRGHEYMAYLQQLDSVKGKSEKVYKLREGMSRLTSEINPENIIFLRGCLVNGEPVPISQIEINDREVEYCDCCGSQTICASEIETEYSKKETFCSHCARCSEDSSLKDKIELKCEECTYTACNWHPDQEAVEYNLVM